MNTFGQTVGADAALQIAGQTHVSPGGENNFPVTLAYSPSALKGLSPCMQAKCTVSADSKAFWHPEPTLSQQPGVLRQQGLVATRRDGKQVFYSMASPQALAVMQVLYQQFCQPSKGKKQ